MNIIHKILILLLITAFTLQSANRLLVVAGYFLNRTYIAQTLCDQRAVRGNCCQGSCHLRKALNEDEQKDQSKLPTSSKEQDHFQWILISPFLLSPFSSAVEFIPLSDDCCNRSPLIAAVFHPPEFVAGL